MWNGMLVIAALWGFQKPLPPEMTPDPNGVRPIPAAETVFTEDMTWMEVRDAIKAGKDTIIIATGGVEQNGPYNVTGKHNVILRGTTEAIARQLGNALVAPIVPFVPEGQISPPTEHMLYPGTVSVTEETFRQLLKEICACFKQHGFKRIILIGDSGGNQPGMRAVAKELTQKWGAEGPQVLWIREYFNWAQAGQWVEKEYGIKQVKEGFHDDFQTEASMIAVDPQSVRLKQRLEVGKAKINGVSLEPVEKTKEIGRKINEFRAKTVVDAIRKTEGK